MEKLLYEVKGGVVRRGGGVLHRWSATLVLLEPWSKRRGKTGWGEKGSYRRVGWNFFLACVRQLFDTSTEDTTSEMTQSCESEVHSHGVLPWT